MVTYKSIRIPAPKMNYSKRRKNNYHSSNLKRLNKEYESFYSILRKAVSIKAIANYFNYKTDKNGYTIVSFHDNKTTRVSFDNKYNMYYNKDNENIYGDFIDFFINASKECFNEEYTIIAARKKLYKLVKHGKIKARDKSAFTFRSDTLYYTSNRASGHLKNVRLKDSM